LFILFENKHVNILEINISNLLNFTNFKKIKIIKNIKNKNKIIVQFLFFRNIIILKKHKLRLLFYFFQNNLT